MSAAMQRLRHTRAQALVPTVRPIPGGFRVASQRRDDEYLVTRPNGHPACTCPDYCRHSAEPGFRCKHILAVDMAHEPSRLHGGAGYVAEAPPLHVLHRTLPTDDPVRVKLTKNTRGYSWEIAVAAADPDGALSRLQDLEERVRTQYGGPSEPTEA